MCGIAGFIDTTLQNSSENLHATARRMGETLRHRGPDDAGIWVDASAGVALAHRRLSILDVSPAGHQPMVSGSGRYVIVYNGEIYNFQELRKELEKSNDAPLHFRGHSDTEVLLACFDSWNVEPTLSRVNGMFAFALWDRQDRVLYLGRDRLGEKPLYYGWIGNVFLFGSELKALRAHPRFGAEINLDALALYLRHNCVPAPHSIYRGVQKLLPGTFLAVTGQRLPNPIPVPFWSLRQVAESGVASSFRGSDTEALDQLEVLLRDAVRIRMLSDVPLGAFLSGGVDSSLVASLMQAESTRRIKTFSIGFRDTEYDEAKDAARVARHLGTEHTELYVTPQEAMALIPSLPAIYDEPFADSSQIPTFLLSRMARRHVTVGLSGDGGDEVFCGYTRHVWSHRVWKSISAMPRPFRRASAAVLSSVSSDGWDSFFQVFRPFVPSAMKHRLPGQKLHKLARLLVLSDLASVFTTLASHWNDPVRVVIGAEEPPTVVTTPGAGANLSEFTERMMFLDTLTFLPDDILAKVDRASMAVSLEARIPLLDHRVVEFAWRLPMSMKIRDNRGKWILRELLGRFVPHSLVDRPKSGFSIPLDGWLRGPLRDWAESLLAERRIREDGFFHVQPIREKWAAHLSGKGAWQHHLWDILMFQAWWDENRQPSTASGSSGSSECGFLKKVVSDPSHGEFARQDA
jgi:asparagine synthase (glutamine-hydrolysing)